jgi:hypothetical protein
MLLTLSTWSAEHSGLYVQLFRILCTQQIKVLEGKCSTQQPWQVRRPWFGQNCAMKTRRRLLASRQSNLPRPRRRTCHLCNVATLSRSRAAHPRLYRRQTPCRTRLNTSMHRKALRIPRSRCPRSRLPQRQTVQARRCLFLRLMCLT